MNIPKECYEEFGADLDGCSTQENEGCGRCKLANTPVRPNAEGMKCGICGTEVHPLNAHMDRIDGKLDVYHIDCWNAYNSRLSDSYLEPLKVASALRSEIMKLEHRKNNRPKDVSILDYTVIEALKKQNPLKKLFNGVDTYMCPGCKEEVYDEEYCQCCGQRILVE